jgi:tyrosine-protein phosphatase YwqE
MFFFSKKPSPPEYSVLRADMHSHLIPGIDDGSTDVETSGELIRGLMDLGFSRLVTTPHVLGTMYPNTPETIAAGEQKLRVGIPDEVAATSLRSAAEYFLDDLFLGHLNAGLQLLPVTGKQVLCEFSLSFPTQGVKEILFEMQMQGYTPIIAHPERYIYLSANKLFYEELKEMGCLFQLNLLALGPNYGKSVTELAGYLTKRGYYDYVGTDLHNIRQLEMLRDPKIGEGLKRVMDQCRVRNKEIIV